uniref:Cysteine--tRNA ligase n=1 Tax=Aceria tosichella TaxID=561515 RepID=A0A6G1SMZ8_9ACAR
MSKILRLYNSYSRCIKDAKLANGQLIESLKCNTATPTQASLYICGPTVYSESHLGHALTYVRADLFRRVLKSLFGVRLTTVMNITDIDDKILAKTRDELPDEMTSHNTTTEPADHPFNRISEKYYKSFVADMDYVHVTPPDITVMVSKQVNLITSYIRRLERTGHAYLASNGDVYFDVSTLANYEGRIDLRNDNRSQTDLSGKQDIRDFALWKAAKPGEPAWLYESELTGKTVPGRPGWHVQCSAICSAIFGNCLDFHYGGKDLIFPHHYNEQACCCAYHNLNTSKNFHVWSENWLHSGHLVLRDEKMSKSLGNTVGIRKFINETSVNALRLLCVASHYRADVVFNSELLSSMRSLDHKISAFISYISDELTKISNAPQLDNFNCDHETTTTVDLEVAAHKVRDDILTGVCDDLDLAKGLHSILELSKVIYNANLRPKDVVMVWHLLVDWSSMCGLDYVATNRSHRDQVLINLVRDFRQDIRDMVIERMKRKRAQATKEAHVVASGDDDDDAFLKNLLANCDNARARMDEFGFVIRDKKS